VPDKAVDFWQRHPALNEPSGSIDTEQTQLDLLAASLNTAKLVPDPS
jgi:hypothetical protein